MQKNIYRVPAVCLAAAVGLIGAAPVLGALDLSRALAAAPGAAGSRAALLQAESAAAEYAVLAFPGSLSLTAAPEYQRTGADTLSDSQSDLFSLGLTLSAPLGLTDDARDKAAAAFAQRNYAQALLPWTLESVRVTTYSLYAAAWAAQEESRLSALERALSEEEFRIARTLFAAGSLDYADFRKAEEDLLNAGDAAIYSDMRRRITRLELFSWLSMGDDGSALSMEIPEIGSLPRAPELAAHALQADPAVQDALARKVLTQDQAERALGFSLPTTFKLALSSDERSAALSYGTDTKRLALDLEAPLADATGPLPEKPWTLTASVAFALDSGRADALEAERLRLAAEAEGVKAEQAMAKLSLDVRTAYQAWVRASDLRDQAERNVRFLQEQLAAVRARAAQGSVSPTELAGMELDADRAAFTAHLRAVEAEKARLNAAVLARYPAE